MSRHGQHGYNSLCPAPAGGHTRDGERWDSLAWQYYGDPLGYPRIIAANPHVAITPVLPSGLLLLIPVIEAEEATTEDDIAPWLR
ncbi:TPA: tail protein X [Escherichia coli]|nr:tail protein X [Escherichia coli]HDK1999895.1 tail protein X [Escherichia coli]